jgi:DNA polymerase III alpha subunit
MLAREMGFKALGITDHGNIAGTLKFFKECTKTHDSDGNILPYDPITPILGCEFYLSKNRHARSKSEQPDERVIGIYFYFQKILLAIETFVL